MLEIKAIAKETSHIMSTSTDFQLKCHGTSEGLRQELGRNSALSG